MNSVPFEAASASASSESISVGITGPSPVLVVAVGLAFIGIMFVLYVLFAGRQRSVSVRQAATSMLSLFWMVPVVAVLAYVSLQVVPYFRDGGAEVPEAIMEEGAEIPKAVSEEDPTPQIATATSVTKKSTPSPEDSGLLPKWAEESSKENDQAETLVVSSKQYVSVELAENDALQQAREKVRERFHRLYERSGNWVIPISLVKFQAVKNLHIEKVIRDLGPMAENVGMYRSYMQVDLSPEALEKFYPTWRRQIVDRRLWAFGGLFSMLTLLLGTSTTYLRLDTATGGAYRRRLKLAAISMIAAGGLAVGALLPVVA